MRIGRGLLDEIVAHAKEDAPNECCGLIGGAGEEAKSVHRARNLFASPMRFEIAEPVPIIRAIEDAGDEVVGLYHSHPRSEAYPSQTDINLAGEMARIWMNPVWFICSLADPDGAVVRAFAIRQNEVSELELDVAA